MYKRYLQQGILSKLEPLETMAQVGIDHDYHVAYYVNPDPSRINKLYFKVYNHEFYPRFTKIARISFISSQYIQNKYKKKLWILNSFEKQRLINFLNSPSVQYFGISNWQYAIYKWNHECLLLNTEFDMNKYVDIIDAFFKGFYDTEENLQNPNYLPSYHQMPDYSRL